MKQRNIKLVLLILLVTLGLMATITVVHSMAYRQCRGHDFCDEIEDTCYQGELAFWFKVGSWCEQGQCRTSFFVSCWDWDEEDPYYRTVECKDEAPPGSCNGED